MIIRSPDSADLLTDTMTANDTMALQSGRPLTSGFFNPPEQPRSGAFPFLTLTTLSVAHRDVI